MSPEDHPPLPFTVSNPHSLTTAEVLDALASGISGLDDRQVTERQRLYGANRLPLLPPQPAWRRFLSQFQNALLYLLIGSSIVSLLLQHYVDAGVIMAVVLINGIVGFLQEGKAEQAIRSIMALARTRTLVVRNGEAFSLDSAELVPGDIVKIQAGDKLPADLRLIAVNRFQCDESALTGESQPVDKRIEPMPETCELAERANMAHMGTLATTGTATGVVTRTGLATEIGAIAELVQKVELPKTPLQLQLTRFTWQLTGIIIAIAVTVMLFGIFVRQYEIADMFQAAIAIAVASIPEAIPAVVTVILAMGVLRMAHNRALVRRLPAVEVLGSVDVICTDKTGTLTANVMAVREVITSTRKVRVSGEGYTPEGEIFELESETVVAVDDDLPLRWAVLLASLCNDATIKQNNGEWQLSGDPTEGALLAFALKGGIGDVALEECHKRVDVLPFDSDRGYMATLNLSPDGLFLSVKGAPDHLIEFCQSQLGAAGSETLNRRYWEASLHELARQGMRVLALARKPIQSLSTRLDHHQVENGLELVALAGISDPPRHEAIEAIHRCHQAGIQVKMITGDNPVTAAAIGQELGLNATRVLTGHQLSALNASELARVVNEVDVFARTSPVNKLQLVGALQEQRRVVAMTGDGVNDAPALRKANIGIAMGRRGTDAAREASDFILTDDNFATIAHAVEEGRTVYDNILKSMVFILPTSVAEAAVITAAILLGLTLPITPAQILWVNMITAITLALALVFEESEPNIMSRPPRPAAQSFISVPMLRRILLVGAGGALIVFFLFSHYLAQGYSIETARAVAVTTMVTIEAFYLLNCRFLYESIFHRRVFRHARPVVLAITAVMLMQLGFCYLPFMQSLFLVSAIGLYDWLLIVACASGILLVVEIEKILVSVAIRARRAPPTLC